MMDLWTLQGQNHNLTSGYVDHNLSDYFNTVPGVKEAYGILWKRLSLPDGQIIWCYTERTDLEIELRVADNKALWELQVESDDICFIDDIVWNRILGRTCRVRDSIHRQWIRQAAELAPYNSGECYDKIKDEFWNMDPPSGSWWDDLFVENPGEQVIAIIHFPISEDKVKNKITLGSN